MPYVAFYSDDLVSIGKSQFIQNKNVNASKNSLATDKAFYTHFKLFTTEHNGVGQTVLKFTTINRALID